MSRQSLEEHWRPLRSGCGGKYHDYLTGKDIDCPPSVLHRFKVDCDVFLMAGCELCWTAHIFSYRPTDSRTHPYAVEMGTMRTEKGGVGLTRETP